MDKLATPFVEFFSKILDLFTAIVNAAAPGLRQSPFFSALIILAVLISLLAIVAISQGIVIEALLIGVVGLLVLMVSGVIVVRNGVSYQNDEIRASLPVDSGAMTTPRDKAENIGQLPDARKTDIRKILKGAAEESAEHLVLPVGHVRANLFGKFSDGFIRIIDDLTFQMNHPEELTVKMPIGYGSTGRCYETGTPNIAVLKSDWGPHALADPEMRKLHPDLKWIVSVPVLSQDSTRRPIAVLNVDGIKDRRNENDLKDVLRLLFKWSAVISLLLTPGDSDKE